jgi:hypothetical protein
MLRPSGRFLFNVWDKLAANPIPETVTQAVAAVFPADPPDFFARTPHGYHDTAAIAAGLRQAGFAHVETEAVDLPCRAPTPRHPAVAMCQGTPLRNEIEARDPSALEAATAAAEQALMRRFGPGPIEAPMRAYVVSASR